MRLTVTSERVKGQPACITGLHPHLLLPSLRTRLSLPAPRLLGEALPHFTQLQTTRSLHHGCTPHISCVNTHLPGVWPSKVAEEHFKDNHFYQLKPKGSGQPWPNHYSNPASFTDTNSLSSLNNYWDLRFKFKWITRKFHEPIYCCQQEGTISYWGNLFIMCYCN